MLKHVMCDIFREKIVTFRKGLNVVLGDNEASNSIGKSTFLMIIDFVFGGKSYIEKNKDVVTNVGEHEFKFCFEFENETFYFKRGTSNCRVVNVCDSNYNCIKELEISEYTELLKDKYKISLKDISFRGITSTYSRIWQKGNFEVKRPLHEFSSANYRDIIISLIKLFDKYEGIRELESDIKLLEDSKKAVKKAEKYNHIPKVNKSTYDKNVKAIDKLKLEMEKVALSISISVNELITNLNNELIEEINALKRQKSNFENKLRRVRRGIEQKENINQNQFKGLMDIFPNVNLEKLSEIESFHSSISIALKNELIKTEEELRVKIQVLEMRIKQVEDELTKIISNKQVSERILEPLLDLSMQVNQKTGENYIYEKKVNIQSELQLTNEKLALLKTSIITEISNSINSKILELNKKIHNDDRKSPKIIIADNVYSFGIEDNTGTGEAFSNLITFDLAVFKLTQLPILIHDSMLFKNIENNTTENILYIYNQEQKQVFIAIDEVNKYSKSTQEMLEKSKILELSKHEVLFIKDWKI